MINFPIETERLRLRPFRDDDIAALHAAHRDAEVWRFIDEAGPYRSLDDTRARVERFLIWQRHLGHSLWAVTDRTSGELLGDCGLIPLGGNGPEVEVAYRLGRANWGRGMASEAALACLGAGFEQLRLNQILGVVHPENAASLRVMEKIGMIHQGTHGTNELFALSRAAYVDSRTEAGGGLGQPDAAMS